jgi:hypothetical protein
MKMYRRRPCGMAGKAGRMPALHFHIKTSLSCDFLKFLQTLPAESNIFSSLLLKRLHS